MKTINKTLVSLSVGLLLCVAAPRPALPCSGFTAHDGQTVLAGQNEDYYGESYLADVQTLMWFAPAESGLYGYVAWGYANHFSQGGMNDQGLFWDGFATATHTVDGTGTAPFTMTTLEEMMQVSATVGEALAFLQTHNLNAIAQAQYFLVDQYGDSAIFDGSVTTWATEDYQVVTNWLMTQPELGGYPCWRYATMTDMMQNGLELTVDYFRSMAEAVHQGHLGTPIYTRYTTIGELNNGVFHLYYDLDYDNPLTFVLEDELALGARDVWMADLFEPRVGPDATVPDAGVGDDAGIADDAGTGVDASTDDCTGDGGGCSAAGGTGAGGPTGATLSLLLLLLLALHRRRRIS